MRWLSVLACIIFLGCSDNKVPDVSHIKINLTEKRFERDFFSADTNNISASLTSLQTKYPTFLNDYLFNILSAPPTEDSIVQWVSNFRKDYAQVYSAVSEKFKDISAITGEVKYSFQLTKHYFPSYTLPSNIITFVGPLEGYASVLTSEGVAIGLQQYLGKDFPLYQTDYVREIYPAYQVRRFEPAYIPVNVMKAVIDDMFPQPQKRLSLIDIMIEQGKRLHLLKQLMPKTADTLITGYTKNQLEGCYENEGLIWNYFLQNDLLYQSDPFIIRDYISDGPKTAPLGESSPGNIGQFVGWQIVKKYLEKNEDISPEALMKKSAKEILADAKYKPK